LEPRLFRPEMSSCKLHGYGPSGLSLADVERGMFERAHMQPPGGVDTRRETRIICYLAAVILAILVLVAVIVVLTMMVAHHEMDFTNF